MTHRTSADYYAGIPQYPGRISPADLNDAKADAWDEAIDHIEGFLYAPVKRAAHADNPYRASNVEGMNQ